VERSDKREIKPADSKKKPYSRPRLEIYGNIREITQTTGKTGKSDGGGVGNPNHINTAP
jgi:hypothetical protein